MEEEKKEVEVTEEAPAEENQAEKAPMDPNKKALLAFIFACASFIFWYAPVLGLVLAIVSFVFVKKLGGELPEQKPFGIFAKIAKIASLILLIVGAIVTAGFAIWLVVVIIVAIVGAIKAATALVLL